MNTNPYPEAPSQEPWAKCIELQQKFDSLMTTTKGAQNTPQKSPWQGSNQGQRNSNQNGSNNGQRPQRQNSNQNNAAQNNKNQDRGRNDQTKSNAITVRVGGICGIYASAGTTPQPIKFVTSLQYHNPDVTGGLTERANEAGIFVGDIQVTALIDMGAQISTITCNFCEEHGYEIHLVKQMLHLEGTGGLPFCSWGI